MNNKPVSVIAKLVAIPGKEEQLKQALMKLLVPTRAEKACINYDLHQSTTNPTEFVFYENWTSEQAVMQHLETTHIAKFRQEAEELLAEPADISIWHRLA